MEKVQNTKEHSQETLDISFKFNPPIDSKTGEPRPDAVDGPWVLEILDGKKEAGTVFFTSREVDDKKIAKIRLAFVNEEFRNKGLSVLAYKEVISFAKKQGWDGVGSDSGVEGGALVTWKRLSDEGYNVIIHEDVKEKYDAFCKAYENKQLYDEQLEVPLQQSVFKIEFDKEKK